MKTFLLLYFFASAFCLPGRGNTRVEDVPEAGLQPEVAVGNDGTVHLVFLQGDPKASNVRYTTRKSGEKWKQSVPVDSSDCKAVAMGTIRGAQVAVSRKGTIHVVWNGATADSTGGTPLWYARKESDTQTFSKPRNIMGATCALDGGASIVVDNEEQVFVVWHGNKAGAEMNEKARLVFVSSSRGEGQNFSVPEALNEEPPGVCACCSLRALAGPNNELSVFFRGAKTTDTRPMTLLSKTNGGWNSLEIEAWKVSACPMSSASLTNTSGKLFGAWETNGQIRIGGLYPGGSQLTVATKDSKHPIVVARPSGEILVSWIEGSGWNRGGSVKWREFDVSLTPAGPVQSGGTVAAWGKVAGYAEAGGNFILLR